MSDGLGKSFAWFRLASITNLDRALKFMELKDLQVWEQDIICHYWRRS